MAEACRVTEDSTDSIVASQTAPDKISILLFEAPRRNSFSGEAQPSPYGATTSIVADAAGKVTVSGPPAVFGSFSTAMTFPSLS